MEIRPSATLKRSLRALQDRETWLRTKGVAHAAIFGSVARGDDDENSDLDVLLELDSQARTTFTELLQIEDELVAAFGRPVDVVSRGGLRSPKHDHILAEMVPAF